MALGKIIRLNDDGSVPGNNPFQNRGELARSFWTLGHRNLLGISFDQNGRLWSHEMGPKHGDELNLIEPGQNYGWPVVSNGDNYSGAEIPDHDTRPEFAPPKAYWVPSIAPSGLVIYSGDHFDQWKGQAFIGGLVSRALIRVSINGEDAREAERFRWGKRIREVEQGPKGALWVVGRPRGGATAEAGPIDRPLLLQHPQTHIHGIVGLLGHPIGYNKPILKVAILIWCTNQSGHQGANHVACNFTRNSFCRDGFAAPGLMALLSSASQLWQWHPG